MKNTPKNTGVIIKKYIHLPRELIIVEPKKEMYGSYKV